MPENIPPRGYDDPARMAALESRIAAIEARPHVIAPLGLSPAPISSTAILNTDWEQELTTGSFDTCWEAQVSRWSHQAVYALVPWRTGAGTTGEVRLEASFTTSSDPVVLAAASSGTATFRWLHGQDIWSPTASLALFVTARRTAGANSVFIGYPYLALIDPAGATFAGI
jgi:hypothetical protein